MPAGQEGLADKWYWDTRASNYDMDGRPGDVAALQVVGEDEPEPEPDPWDRLDDEPTRWYERFFAYLTLGPARTLERAYRDVTGRNQPATGEWKVSAKRWDWKGRALAYDERHREARLKQREADLMEATERHRRLAALALRKAEAALEAVDPTDLDANDAVKLLAAAAKIELAALQGPLLEDVAGRLDAIERRQGDRGRD